MPDPITKDVGYGKPPEHSRFTAGKSGNPKGRPKGSKNFSTILAEATRQRIRVTINGKPRSITKAQAIALQLTNQASSGNLRAIRDYSQLQVRFDESQPAPLPPRVLEKADELAMESIVERIRQAKAVSAEKATAAATTEPSGSEE